MKKNKMTKAINGNAVYPSCRKWQDKTNASVKYLLIGMQLYCASLAMGPCPWAKNRGTCTTLIRRPKRAAMHELRRSL